MNSEVKVLAMIHLQQCFARYIVMTLATTAPSEAPSQAMISKIHKFRPQVKKSIKPSPSSSSSSTSPASFASTSFVFSL